MKNGLHRSIVLMSCVGGLASLAGGCSGTRSAQVQQVRAVLDTQVEAWYRGDVEEFMEGYWNSPELTFSSEGATRRGWAATLARYRKKYPDRERMGRLGFDDLTIEPLAPDAVLMLGDWNLERAGGPIGGNFTLIFRRIDRRWVIVHDHTSSRPPDSQE